MMYRSGLSSHPCERTPRADLDESLHWRWSPEKLVLRFDPEHYQWLNRKLVGNGTHHLTGDAS